MKKGRKGGRRCSPAAGGESSTRAGSATPSALCPCCCCRSALKPLGCSRSTGSRTRTMKKWAPMTGSVWREEGLLASDLADGEAGLCFCPSVNHPAWFAKLQQGGETDTRSYSCDYYCCNCEELIRRAAVWHLMMNWNNSEKPGSCKANA